MRTSIRQQAMAMNANMQSASHRQEWEALNKQQGETGLWPEGQQHHQVKNQALLYK
ncbi:hypothetical protein [Marinicrinis sediminis]|uniref:Uncharacterized protein n=1 Tax=Marinicrinis sediminis TaxID=1652465 RepID=A0ABW5R5W1_9BACL